MKKYYIGLIALFIVIYILPLGVRPMITPDEYRYAEIPREMLLSNDWVVPRLVGVRYFEKPVMGYWLNAISIMLFGENGFAVRLPSALATGLAAFFIWLLVRVKSREDEPALLAAALFLTFGMVFGIGTFAVLDAPTAMFITGALVFFFLADMEKKFNWKKVLLLVLFGVFCGFAFMTKGLIAFAVPAVVIAPYMIWEKRWKELLILPWIPILAAVLTALPWAIMIQQQEGDFWHYFFVVEHWERFFAKSGTQHPEPFWFFIPVLLGGAMPWLLFASCAFIAFKTYFRDLMSNSLIRFACCWLIFPFLFFSVSSGKLATYILPCYAPLAILLSIGLLSYFRNNNRQVFDVTAKILFWLLIAAGAGFVCAQIIADCGVYSGLYLPDERWKWLLAAGAMLVWCFFLRKAFKSHEYRMKLVCMIVGPVVVFAAANCIIPHRVLQGKAQGLFLAQFKDMVKPDTIVVAHPNVMHAVAWEYKHNDIFFYTHGGELEYGLKYNDSKHRIISNEQFLELLKKTPKGKIIYIMRGDFREGVPQADFEVYEHGIMFSHF